MPPVWPESWKGKTFKNTHRSPRTYTFTDEDLRRVYQVLPLPGVPKRTDEVRDDICGALRVGALDNPKANAVMRLLVRHGLAHYVRGPDGRLRWERAMETEP